MELPHRLYTACPDFRGREEGISLSFDPLVFGSVMADYINILGCCCCDSIMFMYVLNVKEKQSGMFICHQGINPPQIQKEETLQNLDDGCQCYSLSDAEDRYWGGPGRRSGARATRMPYYSHR